MGVTVDSKRKNVLKNFNFDNIQATGTILKINFYFSTMNRYIVERRNEKWWQTNIKLEFKTI